MRTLTLNLPALGLGGVDFSSMFRVASERRKLADLDPTMLRDMGLTPDDVARESSRPFWDVPSRRRF